jgi:L-ribulokinase
VPKYTVGIDFGTESGRAVLVDCADGSELATSVYEYANGVIGRRLPAPNDDVVLELDWALQDPDDYIRTFQNTIPRVLAQSGVDPSDVIGVGIDSTACTMLPTTRDGTPLCRIEELRRRPHAWVKLWKHHSAQPEADLITDVAAARAEPWLQRYGGRISSEWFFAKSLQILNEDPDIYRRAERLIDAADWVVWQLTGKETRSNCIAGYKAMWNKRDGFPSNAYFAALSPRFEHVVDEKMSRDIVAIGSRAGRLSEPAAAWTGLRPGTPVAVANVDAHVSPPAVQVSTPGTLVAIMGTSTCHILLGDILTTVAGMCGVVEDGVIPGLFAYEAGQSAVGDIFAWFLENGVPDGYHQAARERGVSLHQVLEEEAAKLHPGKTGLLALDWWNGNRSILVDVGLSGLMVGMTLATTAPDVYRALIEATAFGTRVIVDSFRAVGLEITEIVTCGGLPQRNKLMMQIYADVTGLIVRVAGSPQTPALGSAMFAAVAAGSALGGHDLIVDASQCMGDPGQECHVPVGSHRAVYDALYGEYLHLHDYFGRGATDVMKRLKQIQSGVA